MKKLIFSRFNSNGENTVGGLYLIEAAEIKRRVKKGHDGLETIYEDMIVDNDILGIMTFGNGEWEVFTQEIEGTEGFDHYSNYAFDYLETNNLFYSQNVFTFRRKQ